MPPKSILKVKDAPEGSIRTSASKSKEERHRELALHHARLIQQQKDAEQSVFESMLELIDLPSSPSADAAAPSPEDVASVSRNMALFQPSDFDELLTERHANGRCGYVLCARPFKRQPVASRFRIVGRERGADEMLIVSKESLEQWCSDACAKRAMYVKVQLSDEAPWLRTSSPDIRIMPEGEHDLPLRVKSDPLEQEVSKKSKDALRTERGDGLASMRPGQVTTDSVVERNRNATATDDADFPDGSGHDLVEGYQPSATRRRGTGSRSEEEEVEEEDHDWNL